MKRSSYINIITSSLIGLMLVSGCSKGFLQRDPIGPVSEVTLANKAGVDGLLIGAYSFLDGSGGVGQPWEQWNSLL